MKITVTWQIGDDERRAINARVGEPGLAPRDRVRELIFGLVVADLQQIVSDHEHDTDEEG